MSWLNIKLVIECLRELSDHRLQSKLWTSDGSSDVSSFTEAVEQLFTDSGLQERLDSKGTVFSDIIDQKIRDLDHLLQKIENRSSADVLTNPIMTDIRKRSSEILIMIESQTKSLSS